MAEKNCYYNHKSILKREWSSNVRLSERKRVGINKRRQNKSNEKRMNKMY